MYPETEKVPGARLRVVGVGLMEQNVGAFRCFGFSPSSFRVKGFASRV